MANKRNNRRRLQVDVDAESSNLSARASGLPSEDQDILMTANRRSNDKDKSSASEVSLREVIVPPARNKVNKFRNKISEYIEGTVRGRPLVLSDPPTEVITDLTQGKDVGLGSMTENALGASRDMKVARFDTPPLSPSPPDPASVGSLPSDTLDAWAECAKQVWEREENMVQKWKDEISNLLTFAGLFSAALTAFNVQYYISLQPQRTDTSTQVLMLISSQLGVFAANAGHTDVTQQMLSMLNASSSSTHIPAHTVSINTLWFSALVFSLSAASIAISVSQWLHHHLDRATTFSEQSVRIWFFRHRSALKWRIPFIISLLPILLQTSLALFLVGLLELLWTLNYIVAGIVTGLVATLLTATMLTALLPTFFADCPFKSSPAWWCFVLLQKFVSSLYLPPVSIFGPLERWRKWFFAMADVSGWREFDEKTVRSASGQIKDKLEMILEADTTILDDTFLRTVVVPCLQESSINSAFDALRRTLQRRGYDKEEEEYLTTFRELFDGIHANAMTMGEFCINLLCKISSDTLPDGQVRETYQLLILGFLERLNDSIPNVELAKDIYCPLLRLWKRANITKPVQDKMSSIMYKSGFTIPVDDDLSPRRPEMLAHADAALKDTSILATGVRSCLQQDEFVAALQAFYKILQNRGHQVDDVDSCLKRPPSLRWSSTGQDAQTIIVIGQITLDMFERITPTSMTEDTARELTQMNILQFMDDLLQDKTMPATDPVVYHSLIRLLGTRDRDLSNEVAQQLARVVFHNDYRFPVNVECVRRPFLSLLPIARREVEDYRSKRLIMLAESAIRMAGRLTQPDLQAVRDEMQRGLRAIAEYFSPSHIESVTSTIDWSAFYYLLYVSWDFPDPGLFPREAVDALARCTSRYSKNPSSTDQNSSQIPTLMEKFQQKFDHWNNNTALTPHPGDDGAIGGSESESLSS